jgi:hypothetical protein
MICLMMLFTAHLLCYNVEKYCRDRQATDKRMRTACWIPKATDTLRISNIYFPRQHLLEESSSMLLL